MSFVKFLPHAVIIAVLAAILQFSAMSPKLALYLVGPAVFQTWALYFLAGAKPLPGLKGIACGIMGVLASILIVTMGNKLGAYMPAQVAFTIAVGIGAFLCILMEKIPGLDFIPAYFLAAGIFFLLPATVSMRDKLIQISIALVVGYVLGFLTVFFRGMYGSYLAAQEKAAAVAKPELAEARA